MRGGGQDHRWAPRGRAHLRWAAAGQSLRLAPTRSALGSALLSASRWPRGVCLASGSPSVGAAAATRPVASAHLALFILDVLGARGHTLTHDTHTHTHTPHMYTDASCVVKKKDHPGAQRVGGRGRWGAQLLLDDGRRPKYAPCLVPQSTSLPARQEAAVPFLCGLVLGARGLPGGDAVALMGCRVVPFQHPRSLSHTHAARIPRRQALQHDQRRSELARGNAAAADLGGLLCGRGGDPIHQYAACHGQCKPLSRPPTTTTTTNRDTHTSRQMHRQVATHASLLNFHSTSWSLAASTPCLHTHTHTHAHTHTHTGREAGREGERGRGTHRRMCTHARAYPRTNNHHHGRAF